MCIIPMALLCPKVGSDGVGSIDNIRGFLSLNLGCFPALHFFVKSFFCKIIFL